MIIRVTTEAILDPAKDIDKINIFESDTNWNKTSESTVAITYVNVKTTCQLDLDEMKAAAIGGVNTK